MTAGVAPVSANDDPQFQRTRNQDDTDLQRERDQQKRLNKDRQQKIKRDTDKLLQLATELKQYVDKSNENTLSLDVVRKAEEIERLAKSVKEKMKEDYTPPGSVAQ